MQLCQLMILIISFIGPSLTEHIFSVLLVCCPILTCSLLPGRLNAYIVQRLACYSLCRCYSGTLYCHGLFVLPFALYSCPLWTQIVYYSWLNCRTSHSLYFFMYYYTWTYFQTTKNRREYRHFTNQPKPIYKCSLTSPPWLPQGSHQGPS
jgi:hypothetical protein